MTSLPHDSIPSPKYDTESFIVDAKNEQLQLEIATCRASVSKFKRLWNESSEQVRKSHKELRNLSEELKLKIELLRKQSTDLQEKDKALIAAEHRINQLTTTLELTQFELSQLRSKRITKLATWASGISQRYFKKGN